MTLTIQDLAVSFGQRAVLQGVDLEITPGEVVGLIGQNGSGKSTLLNTVSGFVRADAGTITLGEEEITNLEPNQRVHLGLGRGFQAAGVFREMTLEENLIFAIEQAEKLPWWWIFRRAEKKRIDSKVDKLLESVDLLAHKHALAGILSGGQLRLLELLRLKVGGGKVILIDEPTAGVSPSMKKVLAEGIRTLAEDKSRSIVIVEHDLKFLFDLVDRVVVLSEGRVLLDGKPKEVAADPKLKEVYLGV